MNPLGPNPPLRQTWDGEEASLAAEEPPENGSRRGSSSPGLALRRETILRARRRLEDLKRRIRDLIGPDRPGLLQYRREYEANFPLPGSPSSKAELVEACRSANVVFCGDYHTLLQAQKTNVKILRELTGSRRVVLGLELLRARDQRHAEAFLAGEISENQFLEAIDYQARWGFPWAHYRLFFDFARAHGLRVVGLDHQPPRRDSRRLLKRDAFAAQVLAQEVERDPEALLWVVFGDLHVAPQHLPHQLRLILGRAGEDLRTLVVFQNNKHLYFDLAERGLLHSMDTVDLGQGRFCILNTPPWIKLRSYLDHLETQVFPNYEDEDEDTGDNPTYEDFLHHLVQDLASFLEIRGPDLEDFQLYTSEHLRALRADLSLPGPPGTLDRLLRYARAFYFPRQRAIYLAAFDANHAAEAAGQFLHHACSGYRLEGRSPPDLFYLNSLARAFGFFASQVLNPKRKTDYFKDHDLFLERWKGRRLEGDRALQRRISRLVVQHQRNLEQRMRDGQRPRLRRLYREDPELGFGVSRSLGSILGDKLYRAMMEGLVTREEIRGLFHLPLECPGSPYALYLDLRRRLKKVRKPFQSKDDFF